MKKLGGAAIVLGLALALFLGGSLLPGQDVEPTAATRTATADALLVPGQTADLETTIETLEAQVREGGPKLAERHASLALGYLQKARVDAVPEFYEKAETSIEASFATQPDDNFSATIARAILAGSRHDFHAQVRWANRAAQINASNSQAPGIAGDALLELGRQDEAFDAYQRSIDLRPDLASFGRLSFAAQIQGDTQGAISAMKRALDFAGNAPENAAWAHWQLGELYIGAARFDIAERHLDEALRLAPDFDSAVESTVHLAAARGDIPGAIENMEPLAERYPLPGNFNFLGELRLLNGDREGARAAFAEADERFDLYMEHSVRVDVDFITFWADRGIHLERALTDARTLYAERESAAVSDSLAWALHANGRHKQAARYAREAIRRSVGDAGYHYHLGMIERARGNIGEARSLLKKALAIDPSWSIIESHRARNILGRSAG